MVGAEVQQRLLQLSYYCKLHTQANHGPTTLLADEICKTHKEYEYHLYIHYIYTSYLLCTPTQTALNQIAKDIVFPPGQKNLHRSEVRKNQPR